MRVISYGSLAVLGSLLMACGGGNAENASDASAAQSSKAGGSSGGRGAAKSVDPCSFITADEVAEITTNKVISTSRSGADCDYHSLPSERLSVTIHDGDGEKRMDTVRRTRDLLKGIGKEVANKGAVGGDTNALLQAPSDVPELGDDAVWGINGTLSVRKGAFFVEVTPPVMHDPATHPGIPLIKQDEKRRISQAVIAKILERSGG